MDNTSLQVYERFGVVRRGSSWFAVPALSIREIVPPASLTAVPAAPALVAGLCHERNEFFVVLRLEALAGEHAPAPSDKPRMLVLTGPHGPWGLLIDEIAGIESLEVSVNAEAKQPDSWMAAVLGSATHDGRVVRVLDVGSLYRFAERSLSEHWRAEKAAPASMGTPGEAVFASGGGLL